MTKNEKILIGCGGVAIVIGVIVFVLGGWVFYSMDQDFKKSTKAAQERIKHDEDAGMEFGKTTDQTGCINEGFRLSRLTYQERDMTTFIFVDSCLQNSKPVQDFCVGVPPHSSPDELKWRADECRKAGLNPDKTECGSVFEAKQSFCHPYVTK